VSSNSDFAAVRTAIAAFPADVATDAIGTHRPTIEEMFSPENHAGALDTSSPIVVGARGTGKSFWSGVLLQPALRGVAAHAYPRLGLANLKVRFGYTGLAGPDGGIDQERLDACVSPDASREEARAFWWATILNAVTATDEQQPARLQEMLIAARDIEARDKTLADVERALSAKGQTLLVVYDALDTVATTWPRRRLLTEALLEVTWAMRVYRALKLKLFLRPDQLNDDALRFVELPKQRTGAVKLMWSTEDLYGLFFSRLAMGEAGAALRAILGTLRLPSANDDEIRTRQWPLAHDRARQVSLMSALAGPFMGDGKFGHKKGKTYDWPISHLGDAFEEVTPRSFLGLMIAAAQHGVAPPRRAITPDGIRHGLRAASRTRVDQLHQEFPWIKGVLAPLDGLLLPQEEKKVFSVWKRAGTLREAFEDAKRQGYLPPFPPGSSADSRADERGLYLAMERIGVMMRRRDERLDMPDLFRVAAKLLKKGAMAPA
jgi:hypothetical protein